MRTLNCDAGATFNYFDFDFELRNLQSDFSRLAQELNPEWMLV